MKKESPHLTTQILSSLPDLKLTNHWPSGPGGDVTRLVEKLFETKMEEIARNKYVTDVYEL